jgi:phage I-like protein
MDWARILAFATGMVDQELLARIEYLAAENRILKAQLKGRLQLSDAERATLGEIGHRLGRKVLDEVATVQGLHAQAKPKAYTVSEIETLDAAAQAAYDDSTALLAAKCQ